MSGLNNKILGFLVVLVFLMPLSACAGAQRMEEAPWESGTETPGDKVKLKIFTQYTLEVDEKQPYDYAFDKVKKLMPEVELELDVQPQDDSNKLKIYAASGNLPDIIQVTSGIIELFRLSDNLLVLDDYVKDTGIEERILPVYRELLRAGDGHCYAVPRTAPSTHLMFYNRSLFEENGVKVPENYDEFLSAVKTFRGKGITPLALFAKETWPGVMLFEDFITRYEPEGLMRINRGEGSLTEEAYRKAAGQIEECVRSGLLSRNAFTTDYDTAFAEFTGGKAAMFINGSWALGPLGDRMGDNVDYMDFPLADTATVKSSAMNRPGGGFDGGYSVSANTKHKEIAGKYTCLFALEIANGRVAKAGMPNPLTGDGVKPDNGYPPISLKYAEQVKNYKSTTVFPWALNSKVSVILGDNCARLLTGGCPAERFAEETDREIRDALK